MNTKTLVRVLAAGAAIAATPAMAQKGAPPVEIVDGLTLPGVSAGVAAPTRVAPAKQGKPKPAAKRTVEVTEADIAMFRETNIALKIDPGTTELVPIAMGHFNRIVTPFENPQIITVNDIIVKKSGASMFVTTQSAEPASIHILSNDPAETRGVLLTLVPKRIPPRTIHLAFNNRTGETSHGFMPVANPAAERWEESAPYVQTIIEMFTLIARGEVPPGYVMAGGKVNEANCRVPGLRWSAGQRITGSSFSVLVMHAVNTSGGIVEISESAGCRVPGIVAVAPWPNTVLRPGEQTEVYVAVSNHAYAEKDPSGIRPSLIKY